MDTKDREAAIRLSHTVIGVALKIHTRFGHGMREGVYETLLAGELREQGHVVKQQVSVPLKLDGHYFNKAFTPDLVVDGILVIEVKVKSAIVDADIKQVVTYLKLMNLPMGLILNFGTTSLRYGIKRVVN
jgi:GxxExxY protein